MAKLSISEVEHIADLSKLELSPAEKEKFAGQLSSVLSYVSQLNEVKTDDVHEISQITGLTDVMAEDEIKPDLLDHNQIASNAPEFKDGSFVVPGVFE